MIGVAYYLFSSLGISSKPGRLMLPKWVRKSKKRLNEILSTVTKAKNDGLRTNSTESLLKDLGNGVVDRHEFKMM